MMPSTLSLLRVPVNLPALARWAADRGWVQADGFDEGRALHHLLAETFGKAITQPFRLLVQPRSKAGSLYAYTSVELTALHNTARAIALPENLTVLDLGRMAEKPMPTNWIMGQQLGFDLHTRPVRRLNTALASFAKGAEIDAFLADVLRKHPDSPPELQETTREAVYLDWLSERLAGAATLDVSVTRLARFRRTRVARGAVGSDGPEATFHGTLQIADPLRFADLLMRGVGRHRAYGFGMLLLRAPGKRIPEH